MASYLLQEDGSSRFVLEDESGLLLLEGGDGGRPLVGRSLADETPLHDGILTGMASTVKYATFAGTARFLFTTNLASGAAAAPSSAFESADVRVYKDGGTTESTAGVTMTSPFDGVTGLHQIAIDLSADTSFYSLGSDFDVMLVPDETIEGQTVVAVIGSFRVVAPELSAGVPSTGVIAAQSNVITADALATDAVTEIANAVAPAVVQAVTPALIPPASQRQLPRTREEGPRGSLGRPASQRQTPRDQEEGPR